MYLLDTNIISYWMRGDQNLIARIRSHKPSELSISTITLAEILFGIQKSPIKKRERRQKIQRIASHLKIYPFDEPAAHGYATVRVHLEKTGQPISERDTQIASIGLANKLVVVTHNSKEFNRVPKLTVEDWAI